MPAAPEAEARTPLDQPGQHGETLSQAEQQKNYSKIFVVFLFNS